MTFNYSVLCEGSLSSLFRFVVLVFLQLCVQNNVDGYLPFWPGVCCKHIEIGMIGSCVDLPFSVPTLRSLIGSNAITVECLEARQRCMMEVMIQVVRLSSFRVSSHVNGQSHRNCMTML